MSGSVPCSKVSVIVAVPADEDEDDLPVDLPLADAAPAERTKSWGDELDADGNPIRVEADEDEDDDGQNLSLAAMEASLKPRVLETLDSIAGALAKRLGNGKAQRAQGRDPAEANTGGVAQRIAADLFAIAVQRADVAVGGDDRRRMTADVHAADAVALLAQALEIQAQRRDLR